MKEDKSNTKHVIDVRGLVKHFGSTKALDGLDLTVKKGEVHGFLGPNGAGKSTTIRVLLGLLRKTDGEATVLGGDPWKDAVELHEHLAYVPGDVNLWPNLSGGEAIDLFGKLRGGLNHEKRDMLLERFKLDPTKKARTYSKGNRQKVALVAALASDVDLYILDEPTSGLDPLMEAVFQEEIRVLKKEGRTVLLSSHILAEAEALCDRITIIRDGKTAASGTLNELRHLRRIHVSVTTKKPLGDLDAYEGLHNIKTEGKKAEFEVDAHNLDQTMRKLSVLGIEHLTSTPPSLESLFMHHYSTEEKTTDGKL